MTAFVLTQKAREDLLSIGRYTENKWGKNQRNRYLTMMDKAFLTLAENPSLERSCDAIKQGYKAYTSGKHVIFYRYEDHETIKIVRILHERMDVEKHF